MKSDELIASAIVGARANGKNRVRVQCPFCPANVGKEDRRKSLGVEVTTGYYKCFRCNERGRANLVVEVITREIEQREIVQMELPEGFTLLSESPRALCFKNARKYLIDRGVFPAMWETLGIGACATGYYAGRVIVPIRDAQENLVGWVARVWTKKADVPYLYPKDMNRADTIYNAQALLIATDIPALVVEGVFDAIHLWPDAVALLGKHSESQVQQLIAAKRPIVIVGDGDAWEECEMLAARLNLEGKQAGSIKLEPRKDPDDYSAQIIKSIAARTLLQFNALDIAQERLSK